METRGMIYPGNMQQEYNNSLRNDSMYRLFLEQQVEACNQISNNILSAKHHLYNVPHKSNKAKSDDNDVVEVDVCIEEPHLNFQHSSTGYSISDKPINCKIRASNYRCRVCLKTFTQSVNLFTHERIHSGERPFRCEVCLKTFTQQPNLMKHLRIHTGEKPYICQICDKSFTQQANLTKHIRIHTGEKPYTCNVCDKSFTQQANLNKHNRLHTGEKPFPCQFCSKKFAQQANLDRHERIHTGKKPYTCKICWKTFSQHNNLTKHQLTHKLVRENCTNKRSKADKKARAPCFYS